MLALRRRSQMKEEKEKERRQLETSEIVTVLVASVVMCYTRRSEFIFTLHYFYSLKLYINII